MTTTEPGKTPLTVEEIIRRWSADKYKDVMLPALGAFTCSEVIDALSPATALYRAAHATAPGHELELAEALTEIIELVWRAMWVGNDPLARDADALLSKLGLNGGDGNG